MYFVDEKFLREHNDLTVFEPMNFKPVGVSVQTIVENDFECKNLNYKINKDEDYFTTVKKEDENFDCIYVKGH